MLHRLDKEKKDSAVNPLHKKNTGKEMHMNIQIGDYEVDSIILDLGSDVNILRKKTWNKMGMPMLFWSPVPLRLANHAKVQPMGRVSNLVIYVEGMKTHADFDVIEFFNGEGSYPALLGI